MAGLLAPLAPAAPVAAAARRAAPPDGRSITAGPSSPRIAVSPGTKIPHTQMLWINQRLDGKTPEFYSRNWYIHAGHLDGLEAESDDSRRVHKERGEEGKGRWYIQNRVLEPITPTAWVVNGFSDYLADGFIPGPGERYDPKAGLGEESFDKWPPRLVQGHTYRVL